MQRHFIDDALGFYESVVISHLELAGRQQRDFRPGRRAGLRCLGMGANSGEKREKNMGFHWSEITTPDCVWTPPTVATSETSPVPRPAGIVRLIW